jgi:tetratricopeptide (TPR) repeat protein
MRINGIVPVLALAALAAGALTGCAPKRVDQDPILENNDRVPEVRVDAAASEAAERQAAGQASRDSITASALASCAGQVCTAVTRGELALGMNEVQVLAATRTTEDAWSIRRADGSAVMVPKSLQYAPKDAAGEVVMVQVANGVVQSYSYREPHGIRVVSSPEDASTSGRAESMADMLLREGDDYAARGEFDLALNRYDRAHILKPNDPMVIYRVATTLDKQLRPVQALIQYQRFLHDLEIERIRAVGEAYGNLAEAIAHARERVIVLERQSP